MSQDGGEPGRSPAAQQKRTQHPLGCEGAAHGGPPSRGENEGQGPAVAPKNKLQSPPPPGPALPNASPGTCWGPAFASGELRGRGWPGLPPWGLLPLIGPFRVPRQPVRWGSVPTLLQRQGNGSGRRSSRRSVVPPPPRPSWAGPTRRNLTHPHSYSSLVRLWAPRALFCKWQAEDKACDLGIAPSTQC